MAWVTQHTTVWASHARQDIGAAGATFEAGLYTDMGVGGVAAFRVEASGITFAVAVPGSYSVAPTITIPAANGFTTARVNAAATVALSAGGLGPVTFTNKGKAYLSVTTPTPAGGTGSGGSFTAPTLLGNTLQQRFVGTTGAFGSAPLLLYTAGLIGQTQACTATAVFSASTDKMGLAFRVNLSTNSHISIYFTGTKTQVWLMKNGYNGAGTGTATLLGDTGTISAPAIGDTFSIRVEVVSTTPTLTTVTVTITDVTTSAVLGTVTKTTSDTDVQAAGQVGLGFVASTGISVATLQWDNTNGVVTVSPPSIAALDTQNFTLVGAATSWLSNPPTIDGVPATLNSVTVTDNTHCTMNITAGATAGNIQILGGDGQFVNVTVSGINAPTIVPSIPTNVGCTLTASAGFSGGAQPYQAKWLSSLRSNDTPGSMRTVSTQTGLNTGVVPTPAVDTGATAGVINFYILQITDNNGQIAYTNQTQAVPPSIYTGKKALPFGDSITVGIGASSRLNTRLVYADVTTGGTGYTNGSGATGELVWTVSDVVCTRKAVVGGSIRAGGAVVAIWFLDQGEGYTSGALPTITGSGGGGSGVIVGTPVLGGGHVRALEIITQGLYGFSDVQFPDGGRSGTQAANWIPIGTTAGGATNTTFYYLASIKLQATALGVKLLIYGLAINDSNIFHAVTPANFKAQVNATIADVVADGYSIILKKPTYPNPAVYAGTSPAAIARLQDYITVLAELEAQYAISNPGMVFLQKNDPFTLIAGHLNFLADGDGLHPEDNGHWALIAGESREIHEKLYLVSGPGGVISASSLVGGYG